MQNLQQIATELKNGETILYLGMGIFENSTLGEGQKVPYDSNSLILALNNGRPMAPKLMYEFSRAAMNMEHSVGRKALEQKLTSIFSQKITNTKVHELVKKLKPNYIIDTNYDDTLLSFYEGEAHSVILGKARLGAELDRFEIHEYNTATKKYEKIAKEYLRLDNPIIFKPMGSHTPDLSYIISDADFVDWITEAMGGFALPPSLKDYRKDKKYLFLGFDFAKDTQRMVANEITLDLDSGYFVYGGELGKNGINYLKSHKMGQIVQNCDEFAEEIIAKL